jgi:hypothetical protein
MVVADFNGDRRDDIAYDSDFAPESNKITVLLSRPDGTLTARLTRTRIRAAQLVAGDLNEDGHQDLVTSSLNFGDLAVLLGDGAGRFVERAGPQILPSAAVRAIAQLDADAHLDVLVLTYGPTASTLQVLRGDGTGALRGPDTRLDVPGMRWGLAVSDFDGDNQNDVALDTTSSGKLSVAFGNGTGNFRVLAPAMEWNFATAGLAVADFNRDGRLDLGIDPIGGTMALAGDGAGHFVPFPASRRVPVIGFAGAITGDFNGDGTADLADTTGSSDGDIYVWLGDGHGRFKAADGSPEWGGRYPAVPAMTGDFNGDGRPDLVGASGSQRVLRVHLNTGGRPRQGTGQSIGFLQASPHIIERGGSVNLAARLRCHPGDLELFRRTLRRPPEARWQRLARVKTNQRGMALYSDEPRISVEYQWRATGAASRIVKPTRRRSIIVTTR